MDMVDTVTLEEFSPKRLTAKICALVILSRISFLAQLVLYLADLKKFQTYHLPNESFKSSGTCVEKAGKILHLLQKYISPVYVFCLISIRSDATECTLQKTFEFFMRHALVPTWEGGLDPQERTQLLRIM